MTTCISMIQMEIHLHCVRTDHSSVGIVDIEIQHEQVVAGLEELQRIFD
jgi:hypothetical protein